MSKYYWHTSAEFADTIHRHHCYVGRLILACRCIGRALTTDHCTRMLNASLLLACCLVTNDFSFSESCCEAMNCFDSSDAELRSWCSVVSWLGLFWSWFWQIIVSNSINTTNIALSLHGKWMCWKWKALQQIWRPKQLKQRSWCKRSAILTIISTVCMRTIAFLCSESPTFIAV